MKPIIVQQNSHVFPMCFLFFFPISDPTLQGFWGLISFHGFCYQVLVVTFLRSISPHKVVPTFLRGFLALAARFSNAYYFSNARVWHSEQRGTIVQDLSRNG